MKKTALITGASSGIGRALTMLVNNAGTGYWDYFGKQAAADVQRDIDLNVTALTTLTHGFVDIAKKHGKPARILNISSLTALLATPRYAVYSATKAYVLRFSKILSYEFRKKKLDISICCSCAGISSDACLLQTQVRSSI